MRVKPCGLTVTNLPGWPNMTLAAEGEISLPNKQKRVPAWRCSLAQLANSSGVGVCPISAAQRRTMKPSMTFASPIFMSPASAIEYSYKKYLPGFQVKPSTLLFIFTLADYSPST
jgi:hypothetical protein